MDDVRRLAYWEYTVYGWIFGTIGVVGVLLASVGVYGVLAVLGLATHAGDWRAHGAGRGKRARAEARARAGTRTGRRRRRCRPGAGGAGHSARPKPVVQRQPIRSLRASSPCRRSWLAWPCWPATSRPVVRPKSIRLSRCVRTDVRPCSGKALAGSIVVEFKNRQRAPLTGAARNRDLALLTRLRDLSQSDERQRIIGVHRNHQLVRVRVVAHRRGVRDVLRDQLGGPAGPDARDAAVDARC